MWIEFGREDIMRTKISKRESCTHRDVNKYFQTQIQEKVPKRKVSPKWWGLFFNAYLVMQEKFHLRNGELKTTLTTNDFRVTLQHLELFARYHI